MTKQELDTLRKRYDFSDKITDKDLENAFEGTLTLALLRLSNASRVTAKEFKKSLTEMFKTNKG